MKILRTLAIVTSVLLVVGIANAQHWSKATTYPNAQGAGSAWLMTDGTVIVHSEQATPSTWYKLTPNKAGSYVAGTWKQIAAPPSSYDPLFFGSVVLPDGRLIIEGGEYNHLSATWTNMGAIYNPVNNTWTMVNPPVGWSRIGDAQSVTLPNGTYMQADCCDLPPKWAYFNPSTLTWTKFQGSGKFDVFDEEGWSLLPNGKVLTVDAYVFQYDATGMNSELYNPSTHTWSSAGNTVVQLWDSHCGVQTQATFEVGPAVLRPDGSVFATGSNTCGTGHTAIYANGTWQAGPNFPVTNVSIADGPAALEINGKVLMMGSVNEDRPATFYEWDGAHLTEIAGPPNAPNDGSFYGHFLELPTGQILFTDYSTDVEIFTPAGTFQTAWRPTITTFPATVTHGHANYSVSGLRFAGMSQGAAYGDDYQSATNYALVRLTNMATHHVFYAKTHNQSSYAVQSAAAQTTHFDVPATMELGPATLEVVVNGIPSLKKNITVN